MSESTFQLWRDAHKAFRQGPAGLTHRQRSRLTEMVAYARAHSPYYRESYRDLPEQIDDPALLPVTSKRLLMDHFDDWVTDRSVHFDEVRAFVDDPARIGEPFHGQYLVATTSGTTGLRGIFLLDERSMKVPTALSDRGIRSWLGPLGLLRMTARGGRLALLIATGGHFVGYAGYVHTAKTSPWRRSIIRVFSVYTPLPELVRQLNEYRPAIIIGYASVIQLLVAEQAAGQLDIHPVLIEPAGETMTSEDLEHISHAFHAKVHPFYAATECTYLTYSCAYGWHHLNSDWAILEPVDKDLRPTPPGELSHTVLISNLANRVQPILRYDLGDSVVMRAHPCPCGSPLPALQVQGRSGDALTFPGQSGKPVRLAPLALSALFDRIPGIELAQVVQSTPTTLRIRLRLAAGTDPQVVWRAVHNELTELLSDNGLGNIQIERADEAPEQSAGGKYRTIIPLAH